MPFLLNGETKEKQKHKKHSTFNDNWLNKSKLLKSVTY